MGTEAQNYGMQTLDKNDWYQVMGHLEKCAFETNAAIAQLSIRPYSSNYTLNNHLVRSSLLFFCDKIISNSCTVVFNVPLMETI